MTKRRNGLTLIKCRKLLGNLLARKSNDFRRKTCKRVCKNDDRVSDLKVAEQFLNSEVEE